MHDLQQDAMEKTQYIKYRGLHVVEMWECDKKKELEHDEDIIIIIIIIKTYLQTITLQPTLLLKGLFT
jgi:F0F1-type ATP synthase alpha subunit